MVFADLCLNYAAVKSRYAAGVETGCWCDTLAEQSIDLYHGLPLGAVTWAVHARGGDSKEDF